MEEKTIPYIVNDTESYGTRNGFSEFNDDVQAILGEIYGPYAYTARQAVRRLSRSPEVKAMCMSYYRPYPVHDDWGDEIKARVRKMIEDRTASGKCLVPYELARQMIFSATRTYMAEHILRDISEMERELDTMQLQKENGRFSGTREEAREKEYRYNEMNNQGGYGYVPRFYSAEDEQWILERLSKAKAIIERIGAEDEI